MSFLAQARQAADRDAQDLTHSGAIPTLVFTEEPKDARL